MNEYHKIQTVWLRDPDTKHKTLLPKRWACREFAYLSDCPWIWTEKVDGTNIRVMVDADTVRFGGKTDAAQIPAFLVDRLRELFDPRVKLLARMFPKGACLYGEGYGAKIQKGGGNYRADQDFVLFDVKVGDFWLSRDDVEAFGRGLGLDVVPLVGIGTLPEAISHAKAGFHSKWGEFMAEGLVMRPLIELATRDGHRIITKIKHKDFQ